MPDVFRATASRSWALLLGYVACVLGTLPFTRGLVLTLRDLDLLTAVIGGLYAIAVLGIAYHVVFSIELPDRVAFVVLAATAGVTAALLMGVEFPEERVHFLQYGLMAGLAAAALRWHMSTAAAYALGLGIACGVGWFDEILQDILPNRVYDVRDIVMNAEAALLGVVADEALHDRLGWRGTRRTDGGRADRR